MRQVVELDDRVVRELKTLTGQTSGLRALLFAVHEYLLQHRREHVLSYLGKGKIKFRHTNRQLETLDERA